MNSQLNIFEIGSKIIEEYSNKKIIIDNSSPQKFLQLKRKFNDSEEFKINNEIKEEYSNANSFSINKKQKIIKCFFCGKIGHISKNCEEKKEEMCVKCLKTGHNSNNCPIEKCHICHQKDHREWECPLRAKNKNIKDKFNYSMKLSKCGRCLNKGHESLECLINPSPIQIINGTNESLCCFCNSPNHYICPFNEDIFLISDKESKNNKNDYDFYKDKVDRNDFESIVRFFNNQRKIFEYKQKKCLCDIKNEDIKNINFCCKCGGLHHYYDCKNENKKNINNKINNNNNSNNEK